MKCTILRHVWVWIKYRFVLWVSSHNNIWRIKVLLWILKYDLNVHENLEPEKQIQIIEVQRIEVWLYVEAHGTLRVCIFSQNCWAGSENLIWPKCPCSGGMTTFKSSFPSLVQSVFFICKLGDLVSQFWQMKIALNSHRHRIWQRE